MSKLTFVRPDAEAPGYLRRMRQALVFLEAFEGGDLVPATVDKMVEFLLPNISEPVDRDEAREALLDASRAQYQELLKVIMGGGEENPTE